MHGGDDRHFDAFQPVEEIMDPAIFDAEPFGFPILFKPGDIGPGAERALAFALEDDGADMAVGREPGAEPVEFVPHIVIEGVEPFRPVQGNDQDIVVLEIDFQRLEIIRPDNVIGFVDHDLSYAWRERRISFELSASSQLIASNAEIAGNFSPVPPMWPRISVR